MKVICLREDINNIYFVRHGESEENILKVFSNRGLKHGLTEKGREQVESLAEKLKVLNFMQYIPANY